MIRKPLSKDDSLQDAIIKLSEGNPGAINVICSLITELGMERARNTLLTLDSMNIRGSQIWVAYKDHCKESLTTLEKEVAKKSRPMVNKVNIECPEYKATYL